jgi:hypothetical protein
MAEASISQTGSTREFDELKTQLRQVGGGRRFTRDEMNEQ